MHENRETSGVPRPSRGRGRSEKMQNRTSDMHASEESDRAIVPMNQPNKEGQPSAEVGEGRARAKENIAQSRARHRAGPECPRDCAVCDKQHRLGSKNASLLCSTM